MQQDRDLNAWKAVFHRTKRKLVRNMVDAENTLRTALEKEEWAKEAVDEATLRLSGMKRALGEEMRQFFKLMLDLLMKACFLQNSHGCITFCPIFHDFSVNICEKY